MESITNKAVLVNCGNMGASGILLRGKTIDDDWQVHRDGCRDLKEMRKLFGRYFPGAFEAPATLEEIRNEFNAEMGGGGTAGFEVGEGWDFDAHVNVKPCVKG